MRIGGLQRCSLIDFPGRLACVVFTQGCNFRCPYCHNPELVLPERFGSVIPEEEIFSFLEKRKGKLTGVVVTGGEPTHHGDLIHFLQRIKEMGYDIKLDTNGSHPQVLKAVIRQGLVDYIAMDIKARLSNYHKAAGVRVPLSCLRESIELIRKSGLIHEFRTTLVKPFVSVEDIPDMMSLIGHAPRYTIQMFRPSEKLLDKAVLNQDQYTEDEINDIKSQWEIQ